MPVFKLHERLFGIEPVFKVLVGLVTFNHSILPEGQSIVHPFVTSLVVVIVEVKEGPVELFDDFSVISHAAVDVVSLINHAPGTTIEEPGGEFLRGACRQGQVLTVNQIN